MRKNKFCTTTKSKKSLVKNLGLGAILSISIVGLNQPVAAYAQTHQSNDTQGIADVVVENHNEMSNFDDPVDDAKRAAGKKVYEAAKMVDAQIQNLPNLTDQQKKDFSAQLHQAVMNALANINATNTPDGAMSAGNDGVIAIEGILKDAQQADENIINDAKIEARDVIIKRCEAIHRKIEDSDLPQKIKDALTQDLQNATTGAIDAINKSSSIGAIDAAQSSGMAALDQVEKDVNEAIDQNKPLADAKKEAIAKVKEECQKAHDVINSLTYLTDTQKQKYNDMVTEQVKIAIEYINYATSPKGALEAADQGILDIEKIVQQAQDENLANKDSNSDENNNSNLPNTFDASGLASGISAVAGALVAALGIKSKK